MSRWPNDLILHADDRALIIEKDYRIALHVCHFSGHLHKVMHHRLMLWKPQPPPTAYFTSSTLNFVISDSCMQESRHSPLRDIQPQSCTLGTDMLGTTAWLHMWPARFAVPLTCLSNAGQCQRNYCTSGFVDSKEVLFLSCRRCMCSRVDTNHSGCFWRWLDKPWTQQLIQVFQVLSFWPPRNIHRVTSCKCMARSKCKSSLLSKHVRTSVRRKTYGRKGNLASR